MSANKPAVRTASFWMALLAIVISLIGTIVSIQEANILRDQQQLMIEEKAAAVWPFVSNQTRASEVPAGLEVVFSLTNKGVGPALINGITISAGEASGSIHDAMVGLDLTGTNFSIVTTLNRSGSNIVLAAGESLDFYKLLLIEKSPSSSTSNESDVFQKVSRGQKSALIIDQLNEHFCYCSIYGECWDSNNQPLMASEACAGRAMLGKRK